MNMYQIMKKGIRVLFVCLLCILPGNLSYSQSFVQAKSWLFSFPEGENLLLADYGENARELQQMREDLRQHRVALLEGTEHLLIISHIDSRQYTEATAINEASLRASRLRAYIKQKLNLPHECIAFYIDRSGHNPNQLHIYQVPLPLPWFVNQEISYSESQYTKSIDEAVDRYGAIPFVDMYKRTSGEVFERVVYRISDALFEREELDDYLLQTGKRVIMKTGKKTMSNAAEETAVTGKEPGEGLPASEKQIVRKHEPVVSAVNKRQPDVGDDSGAQPFNLTVKTNLLPWCGLAPSVLLGNGAVEFQRGSFMPNLELEYCFASRWSVAASALYGYFTYGNHPDNLWGVSSFSVEPRIWLMGDNRFRWAWIGVFGQYGDFDVKGEKISAEGLYGRTGKFVTSGVSVGCLVPLGAGFCVEGMVQGGYRSVFSGEKYRYDEVDDKNYRESLFHSTGLMIGFKLNIVYRFGFK